MSLEILQFVKHIKQLRNGKCIYYDGVTDLKGTKDNLNELISLKLHWGIISNHLKYYPCLKS